jgi:glycosyltransferase involved in cell wall biosynthesis
MTFPYLSLIIPTHNRSRLLERALRSVNLQNFRNEIEIIVISDQSDLLTDQVCNSLLGKNDIYVRRNGIAGPSASRNLGLQIAKGSRVMFLDDDDAWDKQFMEKLINIEENHVFTSAYFNCIVSKESRMVDHEINHGEMLLDLKDALNENVFVKNQVHMSCFIFSKHLLDDLWFDTSMRAYEDWDFLLGVFEKEMPLYFPIICSRIYEVDDFSTDRRGSSENANNFNAVLDYLYTYRRHPAPTEEIQFKRKILLEQNGLRLEGNLL